VDDQRILAVIESKRGAALAAHRFVHEHPELSHEERECSRYLCDVLEGAGLEVERGVAGDGDCLPRDSARLAARAIGRTRALYDAVPVFRPDGSIEPVHSCGHDAIPAGVITTALAFADLREELPGSLVVFGCPADEIPAPLTVEIGGGKAVSAAAGALGRDRCRALRSPRVRGHRLPPLTLDATRPGDDHGNEVAHG
jgi:metal-dependent amidase/aminoacylase/carboxypeptidase family protein